MKVFWAIIFVVVLILVIMAILIFGGSDKVVPPVSPQLVFDGKMAPFRPKITLTREHIDLPLVLPRIESQHLETRKKGRRALTIELPELLKAGDVVTIKAPTESYNKSSLVKVKGFQILINGQFQREVFLWQTRDGGDVTFKYEENEWGYYYWKAEGGTNLQADSVQNPTMQNIVRTLGDCGGAASAVANATDQDNPFKNNATGVHSAEQCLGDIISCLFGIGANCNPAKPDPPLTNADIQNDMTIVLQKQIQVATDAEVVTTWSTFSGIGSSVGSGAAKWSNYLTDLKTPPNFLDVNFLEEYGVGGDPQMILSNSQWQSNLYRKTLVSDVDDKFGFEACQGQNNGVLCEMIVTFEAVLDKFQFATNWNQFAAGWTTIDMISMWPFYMQVLHAYIITLRETAQRSPNLQGNGVYMPPWRNLAGSDQKLGTTLSNYLPFAYSYYNQYVNQYLNNIVWEITTFTGNSDGSSNNNYCAYNGVCGTEGGRAQEQFVCRPQNGQNIAETAYVVSGNGAQRTSKCVHASLVNNNYDPATNEEIVSEWDQNNFAANASSYVQGGFPGWAPTINRFISPPTGDPSGGLGYFCLTDDMPNFRSQDVLNSIRASAVEYVHEHSGRPFDVLDSYAASANLSCTQNVPGTWTCSPLPLSYTENSLMFYGAPFGLNSGSGSAALSAEGTLLMATDEIPVVFLNSNEFLNGFPFDVSNFSSSGYFSFSSNTLCCPQELVVGMSALSISESTGNVGAPVIRRKLYCAADVDLGNNVTLSGLAGEARPCEPFPPRTQVALPTVLPTFYQFVSQSGGHNSSDPCFANATCFEQIWGSLQNFYQNLEFVSFGLPLIMSSGSRTLNYAFYTVSDGSITYQVTRSSTPYVANSYGVFQWKESSGNTYTKSYLYTTNSSSIPLGYFHEDVYEVVEAVTEYSGTITDLLSSFTDSSGMFTYSVPGTGLPAGQPPSSAVLQPDGLPVVVNGTCTANTAYNSLIYDNLALQSTPQMLVYNFNFTAVANSSLPPFVTVTDGAKFVTVSNSSLQNNYNEQFPDPFNNSPSLYNNSYKYPIWGIRSGLCSSSCNTGTSFEILTQTVNQYSTTQAMPALSLNSGTSYWIRVFEFVDTLQGSIANPFTCGQEPSALCNTCPVLSNFAEFDWSGFDTEQPFRQRPPEKWSAQFTFFGP